MGAGRSGTTLLDIMLGNNPEIFSAGELNRFTEYKGIPVTLDKESKTAIFWKNFGLGLPAEFRNDQYAAIHKVCRSFEYHSGIIKLGLPLFKKSLEQYKSFLNMFFRTLDPLVKEQVLVDSSKYPLRGYYLGKFLPNEIAYVYVKRNPLDMLKSYAKKGIEQPSQGWLMTNLFMFSVNLICIYVFKKMKKKHRCIIIRFDELITEPEQTLNKISRELEIDVSHSKKLIQNKEPFKPGLLFDGNRIRLEKEIFLKPEKKKTMPAGLKDHISLLFQRVWWN